MNRREILKAVAFFAIGLLVGGFAVFRWPTSPAPPKTDVVVAIAPRQAADNHDAGNAISRKEFTETATKSPDDLTKLIGLPNSLGPPGHPTLGPYWIFLKRTYMSDPNKLDAAAYVFFQANGTIHSVSFHDEGAAFSTNSVR